MLNKEIINTLIETKQYSKLQNTFIDEYYLVIKNFLIKNNIHLNGNETLHNLLSSLKINFPEHKNIVHLINIPLLSEEMSDVEKVLEYMDDYNYIISALT